MNTPIIVVLLVIGVVGVLVTTMAQVAAYLKLLRDRMHVLPNTDLPPVSILKPLKGVDDNLYGNLVSFIRQDYPCFELLLGVEDADDPAIAVAQQVQRDFPRAPIRLVVRRNRVGLNPKVNNLTNLLEASRYEHVLISDSNVWVERRYLRVIVAELAQPGVGLVSNVIVGDGEQTLGARIENFHLNTYVLAGVCLGDWLGHPVVVGKSMLMRRADLSRVGGLASVRDVLAEDYVLGARFHEAGWRVVLSALPVWTVNQTWTIRRTLARHGRWAKLRRFTQVGAFMLEPVSYAGVWFLAVLVAGALARDTTLMQLALSGLVTRAGLDVALLGFARGRVGSLTDLPMSLLRDVLTMALWLNACVSRTVKWRGNRLRMGRGTVLTPTQPIQSDAATAPSLG